MRAPAALCALVFLQAAVSSPAAEPIEAVPEVEAREIGPRLPGFKDIPFPRFPARNPKWNPKGNMKDPKKECQDQSQQTNACSAGNPYCCTADGKGGHVCANSTVCEQTIICCNNNNGFQICVGDLDFNVPITINIYL